jgi:putative redox protein
MEISLPGGSRVDVLHARFSIRTDQPDAEGRASAPSPFDLFLASIGTCAGLYVLRFFQQRQLDTAGLALSVTPRRDPERKLVTRIRIEITLPPSFPEKYREAVLRSVDQCTVKRHLAQPPAFEVETAVPVEGDRSAPPPPGDRSGAPISDRY